MELVFWASVFCVAYVYVGYPLLLAAWSVVAGRIVRKQRPREAGAAWPDVSVVLAARNEAARLRDRLTNLLGQDYPGHLEIIVVSDGSSDDTAAAVASFGDRVRLIELPRGGKPRALNAGVAAARGELVVFADARQRFAPDAISHLAANFTDPAVGGVTGELVLDCEDRADDLDSTMADGLGLYWKYEKWLRRHESRIGSTLGATGALYAVRRELWRPLPEETLLDDVLAPMRIVLGGKRVVFDDRARAYDRVSADGPSEARRKTRTLAGNYQILALEPRLLVPLVNPVWWQYCSHKLGRLIVPWALLAALVASAVLAPQSWFYLLALIVQLGFYGLAAFGAWTERTRARPVDEPAGGNQPDRAAYDRAGLPHMSGGTRVKAG
ncbi:MAG TPA: glycosyltransferase family 2 protein [Vicinamibacterales bacterium]|nr:glycosyltransferase family 2 protein [Vicinamibacterales bacterium]